MEAKDISKLIYFGKCEYLKYDYFEQCIGDESEKVQFSNGYKGLLKAGFNDNKSVAYMMSDLLQQAADVRAFDLFGGINENIKISPYHLVFELAKALLQGNNLDEEKKQFNASNDGVLENATQAYKKLLKSMRKKIDDYDDFYTLRNDFLLLNMLYENKRRIMENIPKGKPIHIASMQSYKDGMKECLTSLICYTNHMVDYFLNHGLSFSSSKSFDNDKYMFIIFSLKLDALKKMAGSCNEIYPLMTYIKETCDKENMDLYFYKYNEETEKCDIKYNYKNFLTDAYSYIKENPHINFETIPTGFFDGWERDDIDEFLDMYTDDSNKNFEVVDPEYIFLPSGERENNNARVNSNTSKNISRDNMQLAIEKRSFYDKNRDKIHTMLLGKNRFRGYVANILNNGYVIFEKYDIVNGCLSDKAGAAYIMNIDNFNSLSSRSIQDLRKIVSTQPDDMPVYQKVNYVCHRGNWQERIQAYFDQYTGIKKEDIDRVVVNSADRAGRNIPDDKNNIYKKQI